MGNRADYRRVWREHRESVMRIRRDYDASMEKFEGYAGSKVGDAKIQEVTEHYQTELAAARQKFGAEINHVLKSMGDKARDVREKVVAPTDEQVRILQAVSYRESLSMKEYQQYMAACGGSNVAQASLYDMARHKVEGGKGLQEPQSDGMRATEVIVELREAAKALLDWDGSKTHQQTVEDMVQARNAQSVEQRVRVNPSSGQAGSIDPTLPDFERKVVGLKFDDGLMEAID